jgi:hypothetical protein
LAHRRKTKNERLKAAATGCSTQLSLQQTLQNPITTANQKPDALAHSNPEKL